MPGCPFPKRHVGLRLLVARLALCALTTQAATVATQAVTPAAATDQCIAADRAIGCSSERSLIELITPRKNASAIQELVQDKLASGQCRLLDYGERVTVTTAHGADRLQVRRSADKASYWIASSWARPASECQETKSAAALHQKLGLPDQPGAPDDEDRSAPFADNGTPRVDRGAADRDDDSFLQDPRYLAERRAQSRGAYGDDGYDDERARSRYFSADGAHSRYFEDERGRNSYDDRARSRYFANEYPPRWQRRDDDEDDENEDDRFAYDQRGRPPPWPSHPLPSTRYAHRCDFRSVMSDADMIACRKLRR